VVLAEKLRGESPPETIYDLGLAPRSQNALVNNGVTTVEALTALSLGDLASLRRVGETTIEDVVRCLTAYGLALSIHPTGPVYESSAPAEPYDGWGPPGSSLEVP